MAVPVQRYEDLGSRPGDTIWINNSWKGALEAVPSSNKLDSGCNGNYIQRSLDGGGGLDENGQELYAEVGDCDLSGGHLTSFNRSGDPAPYATTTLAMQNRVRTLVRQLD